MVRFSSRVLLSLFLAVGSAGAQVTQAQPGAQDETLVQRFLNALDSGQWTVAAAMMGQESATTGKRLESTWKSWARMRGSDRNWRGQMIVMPFTSRDGRPTNLISVPLLRTGGHQVIHMDVRDGKLYNLDLAPRRASFGVYARLAGRAYQVNGDRSRWRIADSGQSVLEEYVMQDGSIYSIRVIKPLGPSVLGSLTQIANESQPRIETGSIASDGTVTWQRTEGGDIYEEVVSVNARTVTRIYRSRPGAAYLQPIVYEQIHHLVKDAPDPAALVTLDIRVASIEPSVEAEIDKYFAKLQRLTAEQQAFWQRHEQRKASNDAMLRANVALNDALETATVQESRSLANLDATLADMNNRSAVTSPSTTSATAPSNTAGRLPTVESDSQPQARPATVAAEDSERMLVACFLVHNGDFDQGKGAVFFSDIGPVTQMKGRAVGDPTGTFSSKVTAKYNVRGAPGCQTSRDTAELQTFMQGVSDSYRGHKKVQTGMTPLD